MYVQNKNASMIKCMFIVKFIYKRADACEIKLRKNGKMIWIASLYLLGNCQRNNWFSGVCPITFYLSKLITVEIIFIKAIINMELRCFSVKMESLMHPQGHNDSVKMFCIRSIYSV